MANHGGGVEAKFVSVNLNKSYGQPSHPNHSPYNGSYGQAAAAATRSRPGSGGGGGGMVVLSRSRSSQKVTQKLSVPPPLNLPSLRKEHEKFDMPRSGSGQAGSSGTGSGPRPGSSGMGWTKPVTVALEEKDGTASDAQAEQSGHGVGGESRAGTAYMPPSGRFSGSSIGVSGAGTARAFPQPVEKAILLRGEDFPSLHAALPISSGMGMKQKENVNQKQKQCAPVDSSSTDQRESYHLGSLVDMRSRGLAYHHTSVNGTLENGYDSSGLGSLDVAGQPRKREEYFPGPLPLVRLNPRSDWADDERDTGHGFAERSRDFGSLKSESYGDIDFDMRRASVPPHKPMPNQYEKWGIRDGETGRKFSSDASKLDPLGGDARKQNGEGRDGNVRRSSPLGNDGLNAQEAVNNYIYGNGTRTAAANKDFGKEKKYTPSRFGVSTQYTGVYGNQETTYGRRDIGHVLEMRSQGINMKESFNGRGAERSTRDRYSAEQSSRYRSDSFQNTSMSMSLFPSGGKLPLENDPLLIFGREKRASSKNDRSYAEDPFISSAGFDERDPFNGSLVGVIKKKRDTVKQNDFHDPVRESFEAELERVQKIQELERQRIIDEQEKALEKARREEEERQQLIREEEERRRRLEEEAREAAWRAEQERLEAIRRVEEQKIAREEEKRRILIEEERRKQAAKQKLLELEARMAKRQAESVNTDVAIKNIDDKFAAMAKEREASSSADLDTWEDSERMVEKITASASFDSPALNWSSDMSIRPYPMREGSSDFLDKGKPFNSWRRDLFENGKSTSSLIQDQEISHLNPRRDSFADGRAVARKEFHGGAGYMPSRTYLSGAIPEPYANQFIHRKEQRWNFPGDVESYGRSRDMDSEFQDNLEDIGWGQNRFRNQTRAPYPERSYPNPEADELYSYGRSRYSTRQPRVFPPPSVTSTQRTSSRSSIDCPGSSGFPDNDDHYGHAVRSESTQQTVFYTGQQDGLEQSELADMPKENTRSEDQRMDKDMALTCDSQSSVSVSSPPNSPPHLSHDELDESGDSPFVSARAEGKQSSPSAKESVILNDNSGNRIVMTASSSISSVEDDEWALENNDGLQQQEEYDEDEDGYQEEDEAHEVDDENIDLNQEFEDLHLDEKGSSYMMDNLVLGFDEGVEVEIPSDDFERNVNNEDRGFGDSNSPVCILGEEGLVDRVQGDEERQEPVKVPSQSSVIVGSETAMQDSIVRPIDDPCTSVASDRKAPSVQQAISSLVDTTPSTGLTTEFNASSAPSQVDIPVKLQFGLFSGPSLIPSPVPAIQIGSIQMPLHLHPPISPSLAHVHPSQPPIFQFGQLRYTSPVSQGILPIPTQSMPFVQPNLQTHYSLNQSSSSLPIQPTHDTSTQGVMKDDVPSLVLNKLPGFVLGQPDQSHVTSQLGFNSVSVRGSADNHAHIQVNSNLVSGSGDDDKLSSELVAQPEAGPQNDEVAKNHFPSRGRGSESQLQSEQKKSESVSSRKNFSGFKPHGPFSGGKGKRYTYAVRNSSNRSSFLASNSSTPEINGFQRRARRTVQQTEFRVRENVDKRPSVGSVSADNVNMDDKSNYNGKSRGNFAKSGTKRGTMSAKPSKQMADSEILVSGNFVSQDIDSANWVKKETGKDMSLRGQNLSEASKGNLKSTVSEEDVDAPLQSGVVRIFKQPGIEAPSDEDDFIEVRSKRQMLNDRREQREKENKAKSRLTKRPSRKPRSTRQTVSGLTNYRKVSATLVGESSQNFRSDTRTSEGHGFAPYKDPSALVVSQALGPIGTPAVKSEMHADNRSQIKTTLQTSSLSNVSGSAKELSPTLMVENKTEVNNNVPTSLGSWDAVQTNQQVMVLTQTQLEEAMKAPRFDTPIASVGCHSNGASEPLLSSCSILPKERPFSSANPINSLLAGEKIQFGAVTSPTLLPPSSRAPGASRSDVPISHKISTDEDDCLLFFGKEKQTSEPCVSLQDSEAEAEAAASAVAVAAISSDEIVGNGLGSVSISDTKNFGGGPGDSQLGSQSRTEDSLSVSLPADLSLETPPISLWPALPSPQSSSRQLLSHFPGGPSHFPFYEMNPMLGGPIFAFGAHEESSGSQSQPQKSNTTTSSSGPLGTWQHTMDSFYGTSAGFTGPFINPPGGLHGVQGPPHMLIYNPFAPVGQYGQVGMSFMGPTYIPSGKPPEWKQSAPPSAVGIGDGDLNNANIASVQRNPPNIPTPIQHLAQGSPLMPMASPLAMFDVSPFQSPADMSVQARWSHVPASPLHAVPLSRQLQQQSEGVATSQFCHIHPIDQSSNVNRFSETQSSTSESVPAFAVQTKVTVGHFADELGLMDSSRSTVAGTPSQSAVSQSSASVTADSGKIDNLRNGSSNNSEGNTTSGYKGRFSQQKNLSAQQSHSSSYTYQRSGATSQRNSAGNDWSNRRMGFHGRNQSFNAEKGFPSSKMKQVYVAKQTTGAASTGA